MPKLFRVVISGRLLPGHTYEQLRAGLRTSFHLDEKQVDRLLSGEPAVVRRDISEEDARKLATRIHALGLAVRSEAQDDGIPEPALAAAPTPTVIARRKDESISRVPQPDLPQQNHMVCPRCGEVQRSHRLCRKCGLDVPRFRAAQPAEAQAARRPNATQPPTTPRQDFAEHDVGDTPPARLLGIGFKGRLGRLDYYASNIAAFLFVYLGLILSSNALKSMGVVALVLGFVPLFFAYVYIGRCAALRLQDIGYSGRFAVVLVNVALFSSMSMNDSMLSRVLQVPCALLQLALLLVPGKDGRNDYGDPPGNGGRRLALTVLALLLGMAGLAPFMSKGPDLQAMRSATLNQPHGAATQSSQPPQPPHIEIFTMSGCDECTKLRRWLDQHGFNYAEYAVDTDPQAARRLRALPGYGDIRPETRPDLLPTVKIDDNVLPAASSVEAISALLRRD